MNNDWSSVSLQTLNLLNNDKLKSHYFKGWYTSEGVLVEELNKTTFEKSTDITLYGKWERKHQITIEFEGMPSDIYWLSPHEIITIPAASKFASFFDAKTDNGKHIILRRVQFNDGTSVYECGSQYTATSDAVLTGFILETQYWQTSFSLSNASVKLTLSNYDLILSYTDVTLKNEYTATSNTSVFIKPGAVVTVTPTYKESDDRSTKVNGNELASGGSFTMEAKEHTITVTSSSCLVVGTLITMADGTTKKVEDIKAGDMLLVFNHETGNFDISPVVFNDYEEEKECTVINLKFSNGKTIRVVSEHGFFDMELMKYVYIDEFNYNEYVNHRFYGENGEIFTLDKAYLTYEYVEVYSPVTAYHLNYFTEGILSMPGGISGLFNIFEYDADLSYNDELKQADIEKYGLFSYEDFAEYTSYEFYSAFPTDYLKVSIGKGYITFEHIMYLIDRYQPKTE